MERAGDKKTVVEKTGIPSRTLGHYMAGTAEPPALALQKLASVCGVSVDWVLNGPDEDSAFGMGARGERAKFGSQIDDELFGRVVDAIQRLYKDQRVSLAPIDLGRLAVQKYDQIIAATDDPDERRTMIKLIVAQLCRDILSVVAEPGTGKASA
ncbi:helix-turn-helix domain-containing protein [Rhodopseudomonas sp. P1]|uniref:helix-turn-helix domain-containing protein n=1 Tax=Rhodopseudomonas sp. P1 TaxID=3434357 RepID=UPI0031FDEACB